MHIFPPDSSNLKPDMAKSNASVKCRRLKDLKDLGCLLPTQTEQTSSKPDPSPSVKIISESNSDFPITGTRSCGHCNLCCIHLQIDSERGFSTLLDSKDDVAKKAGRPCRNLGVKGCRVYERRPKVCRDFSCDWLKGEKPMQSMGSPMETRIIGVGGVNLILDTDR